jgi:hypothetical protein
MNMKNTAIRSIAGATLALTGTTIFGLGALPANASVSLPADNHLYAIGCNTAYDFQLYEIDSAGGLTAVGDGAGDDDFFDCVNQAAWDWETELAYFSYQGVLYSMDVATGNATQIGAITGDLADGQVSIAIGRDGESYASYDCKIATIDLGTGATEYLPGWQENCDGGFYYLAPFAYNLEDDTFYVINNDNTADDTPPIDNMIYPMTRGSSVIYDTSGAVMAGVGFTLDDMLVNDFQTISFDSNGVGWMVWDDGTMGALYSFDAATGEITLAGLISESGTWRSTRSTFLMSPAPAALAETGIGFHTVSTVAGGAMALLSGAVLLRLRRRATSA